MDISQLTDEMHAFVREQGWYDESSTRPQSQVNLALALSLEASEVLELFSWGARPDRSQLGAELADVVLYVMQLASLSEIDLEQAILDKLEVNRGRTWPEN